MEDLNPELLSTVISWNSLWKISIYFCSALGFREIRCIERHVFTKYL